jgi:dihydrodipicolinate synthase/N-acetylneuraminate lyase
VRALPLAPSLDADGNVDEDALEEAVERQIMADAGVCDLKERRLLCR